MSGVVNGELISGDQISLRRGAQVNTVAFTGGQSGTSLSGVVFDDVSFNGAKDPGEPGLPGVVVTLTGTDAQGNAVSQTATTAADGSYRFTGLSAGTYSLSRTAPAGTTYYNGASLPGTIRGAADGAASGDAIAQITLATGDNGVNYNFAEWKAPTS